MIRNRGPWNKERSEQVVELLNGQPSGLYLGTQESNPNRLSLMDGNCKAHRLFGVTKNVVTSADVVK